MNYHLAFFIQYYTVEKSAFPIPEKNKYDYWVSLLTYFLVKSDTIEFRCGNEETDTIKEIKYFLKGSFELAIEDKLTIIKGNKSICILNYLLNHYLNINGEFKWFTVNLLRDSKTIFHSSRWATEFFVSEVNEREIEFIKAVTPVGTDLQQYQI